LEILRRHVFGVDLDPGAIDTLRIHLAARVGATGELGREAARVIETNIRCGDSLTGPDAGSPVAADQPGSTWPAGAIDWRRDFPAAIGAGGFDIIIGNPPYLRERNARALFDSLAATELARRRQAHRATGAGVHHGRYCLA
jgi:hypothetical protein